MKYYRNFYEIKDDESIIKKLVSDFKNVGYFRLPFQDLSKINDFSSQVKQKSVVVVGIGGSSIGSRAIYDFLLSKKKYKKRLHFIDTIDPVKINLCLEELQSNDIFFIFISKSGTTFETITVLRYLNSIFELSSNNSLIISEKNTPLTKYAETKKMKFFELSKNIGGRFSVFSEVGLLPLKIIGVDIDKLLEGAQDIFDGFFNNGKYREEILRKARFLIENKKRFNINVVFSYFSGLSSFNSWYVQLWAESLGKKNINDTRQALTPVGLIGPIDQHSFLQLIMDGTRDKTVTFIKVMDSLDESRINIDEENNLPCLPYSEVSGMKLTDLINMQADATINSIKNQKDIPFDVIEIERVNEINIGKLMYQYQLLTSCVGAFLQINTYDQPGVEDGKKALISSLQKRHKE